jgi:hypothetical protein
MLLHERLDALTYLHPGSFYVVSNSQHSFVSPNKQPKSVLSMTTLKLARSSEIEIAIGRALRLTLRYEAILWL